MIGLCPTCGTELDGEELYVGLDYIKVFCCVCSKYVQLRASKALIGGLIFGRDE